MSKKSPKDSLKVVIDLAPIFPLSAQRTHLLSSPESEKARADKVYSSR